MSEMAERDFSDYRFGDDVFVLADGLLPQLGEQLNIPLGNAPTSETLATLVGAIGKNKVLRDNVEVTAISLVDAALLVARSGVQEPLDRSLWHPDKPLQPAKGTVITGAVANWQDRAAKLLIGRSTSGDISKYVYIPVGNRVMDTGTELTNPNVKAFNASFNENPTESRYAEEIIGPRLVKAGFTVDIRPYETSDGNQIATNFVAERDDLFVANRSLSFARVANAGIQLAVQFRTAARQKYAAYDADPEHPQVYVLTDTFPIALNDNDVKNPREFQSPFTALRQVALTAKLLHEASS